MVNPVASNVGGWFGRDLCSAPHPTRDDVFCRRAQRHTSDHAAFAFSVTEPETWKQTS